MSSSREGSSEAPEATILQLRRRRRRCLQAQRSLIPSCLACESGQTASGQVGDSSGDRHALASIFGRKGSTTSGPRLASSDVLVGLT